MTLPESPVDVAATSYHSTSARGLHNVAGSKRLLIAGIIFVTAFGVRLLNWQSHGHEVFAVQTSVTDNYKHQANLIVENGLASLYQPSSPTSNPDLLGHPLGYPVLLSFVYRIAPRSDTATQLLQILFDSLAAVIIFLIALHLFPAAVGIIAGMMTAFAPQFSWNSFLLLPDSLAAVPILLAVLVLLRTRSVGPVPARNKTKSGNMGRQEYLSYFATGALIGLSCWFRANALLLAPFLALFLFLICRKGKRLLRALLLVGGASVLIAPLTIRNAIVFGEFIPVSLGAGQTLVEGIADYDREGRLSLPQTDVELTKGEAQTFQRPDYANSLFTPDGPMRDRARLRQGFAAIRSRPIWFFTVMVRRAVSMLRLERTPLRLQTPNVQTPLRLIQKLFVTVIFLPLTLFGAVILIKRGQWQTLAILLTVPCYYFVVQSALHTEYRYVLVIHYFLFTLAAVTVYAAAEKLKALFGVR